jgi:hypothetical protein
MRECNLWITPCPWITGIWLSACMCVGRCDFVFCSDIVLFLAIIGAEGVVSLMLIIKVLICNFSNDI